MSWRVRREPALPGLRNETAAAGGGAGRPVLVELRVSLPDGGGYLIVEEHLSGAWIPFALILTSTFLTGLYVVKSWRRRRVVHQ